MEIEGIVHTEKKAAGSAILEACHAMTSPDAVPLGQYRGFSMELIFDSFSREYKIALKNELRHVISIGTDIFGNIQRLDNLLGALEDRLHICEEELENSRTQLANAKEQVQKPFSQEDKLKTKSARLDELNIMLNMDKTENEIVDDERDGNAEEPRDRSNKEHER